MDIKHSKSILAKLLAAENITVVHKKAPTASFAPKERILTLPVWKDMTGSLYDLLTGHEVGHALYTPPQGWHDAIKETESKAFGGFLNIVEDARIEKLVRRKFPGLRPSFYAAYQELLERDFFNLSTKNIDDMLLIDRLNLHFKVGSQLQVEFKGSEQIWIDRMSALETWEEVRQLALDLFEYSKDELEQKKEEAKKLEAGQQLSDEGEEADADQRDMDADLEQDAPFEGLRPDELVEEEPVAETDEAFREAESSLLDPSSRNFSNYYFGKYDASLRIIPYQKVMDQMVFNADQSAIRAKTVNEFKEKNGRYINFLVQQFELKRNAQQQARAKISKSGELDMKKVFNYRLSEDLFRRFTTLPNGKNHGMIMMYDMSGSMRNSIGPTIEQMLILVQFCRKVGIAFEVYGFTNYFDDDQQVCEDVIRQEGRNQKENQLTINDGLFRLRQYFSDSMSSTEFKQQLSNMILVKAAWDMGNNRSYGVPVTAGSDLRFIPRPERLNGTPLNDAIMLLPEIHSNFKARTKSEIVSMVILTDGQSDESLKFSQASTYYDTGWASRTISEPSQVNVVITDLATKKSVQLAEHDRRGTKGLLTLVQDITGAKAIGFHIIPSPGKGDIRNALFSYRPYGSYDADLDRCRQELRRTGVIVSQDQGYAEHYLIKGGRDLAVTDNELEVEDNATTKNIEKAFLKLQSNKLNSRVLLSKFVTMIA